MTDKEQPMGICEKLERPYVEQVERLSDKISGVVTDGLSALCAAIYESSRDGQAAVERFIRNEHPLIPWGPCEACESDEPYEDGACLVCGSKISAVTTDEA